jgi:hypothetical protein
MAKLTRVISLPNSTKILLDKGLAKVGWSLQYKFFLLILQKNMLLKALSEHFCEVGIV